MNNLIAMIAMGGDSIPPKSRTGRIEEQFERIRKHLMVSPISLNEDTIYALTMVTFLRWAMK